MRTVWLLVVLAACAGDDGPVIDRVEPAAAAAGLGVRIYGTGFCGAPGGNQTGRCNASPNGFVVIGGLRATVDAWAAGTLALTVPSTAPVGHTSVVVTVEGVASNEVDFEVLSP